MQNNKTAPWTFRRGNVVLSAASKSVWQSAWRKKVRCTPPHPQLWNKGIDAGFGSDVSLLLSTAVRADRMRGGRNKFGPLYRRDRQMKQQKVLLQTNAEPQMRAESPQRHRPAAPNDLPLRSGHTSDAARQASYPPGPGQSAGPMPRDCTITPEEGFPPPPSLPYPGLYHRTFPGYLQDKGELPYSFSMAAAMYPVHQSPNSPFPYRSTAPSSSSSTSSASLSSPPPPPRAPAQTPDASLATENFLSQLLEGEPDEGQLCAKVVASLQREQANRGKHDRLNTFSIMCKMADQTLFGLVEWARNSALFKELTVKGG